MSTTEQPLTITIEQEDTGVDDVDYHIIFCGCMECQINRYLDVLEDRA